MSHHELISAILRFWRRAMQTSIAPCFMAICKLAFMRRQQNPADIARRNAWDQKRGIHIAVHAFDLLRAGQGRLGSCEIEPAIAA